MDRIFGVAFTLTFQRENRAGAIPQQTLQAWAACAFDAHAGVERQAATVIPVRHRLGVFRRK